MAFLKLETGDLGCSTMTYVNSEPIRILTFDIEEWFNWDSKGAWRAHELRLDRILPKLLEWLDGQGITATFFCLGWIAKEFPSIIQQISELGHEIGCHSFAHKWVYEMTASEFTLDLRKALDAIEDCTGKKVTAYRAPAFSITDRTPWAFERLVEEGIKFDCSVFPARRDFGGMLSSGFDVPFTIKTDSGSLFEFPMSTTKFAGRSHAFTGGGYFRLTPLTVLRSITNRSRYTMVYLHMHDFDKGGPSPPTCRGLRRWKRMVGRANAWEKFTRYAELFTWQTVSKASANIEWLKTPDMHTEAGIPNG